MGGRVKREGLYVYIELIHFAVHLKLTQHCKSTILQLKMKKEKCQKLSSYFPLESLPGVLLCQGFPRPPPVLMIY